MLRLQTTFKADVSNDEWLLIKALKPVSSFLRVSPFTTAHLVDSTLAYLEENGSYTRCFALLFIYFTDEHWLNSNTLSWIIPV